MVNKELKPCPFCYNEDAELKGISGIVKFFFVQCNGCFWQGPAEESIDMAASMWNAQCVKK
jgi:Lar family restriction alleviation protein